MCAYCGTRSSDDRNQFVLGLDQGLLDPREVGRLLPQPQSMMMAQISQRNSSSSSLANDQEVDLEYNPEWSSVIQFWLWGEAEITHL